MSTGIGEAKFLVTARNDGDGTTVKVTAFRTYGPQKGERTSSVDKVVTDKAITSEFAKLAKRAVESVSKDLETESFNSAAESLLVAVRRKEV
jgi:hypothetical protein